MRWYKGQEVPCLKVFDAPTSTTKVRLRESTEHVILYFDVLWTNLTLSLFCTDLMRERDLEMFLPRTSKNMASHLM
jgi:hypothetical protein